MPPPMSLAAGQRNPGGRPRPMRRSPAWRREAPLCGIVHDPFWAFSFALLQVRSFELFSPSPAPAAAPAPASAALNLLPLSWIHLLHVENFLVRRADVFGPEVVGILRQRPRTSCVNVGLRQDYWILDHEVVVQVVLRGSGEAFDDVLLIARMPSLEIHQPPIDADGIDDERIALPAPDRLAGERRVRIGGMLAPIGGDEANRLREFSQN